MKKIVALILCLVMMFTLCACSTVGLPRGASRVFRQVFQFPISTNVEINVEFPISVNSAAGSGK